MVGEDVKISATDTADVIIRPLASSTEHNCRTALFKKTENLIDLSWYEPLHRVSINPPHGSTVKEKAQRNVDLMG